MISRRNFLKALPASALLLSGCAAQSVPANTDKLVFSHRYPLDYAAQFTADCYEGGYTLLSIPDSDRNSLSFRRMPPKWTPSPTA